MTVGYFDSSALVAVLSTGAAGEQGVAVWKALDAVCASDFVEIEVPSIIGRNIDRIVWVWTLSALSIIALDDESRAAAVDIAWLGAPPLLAVDVAIAARVGADHFVTTSEVAVSWATIRGLDAVLLGRSGV
jgi:predicted nucleic acid-binding protein